MTVEQKQELEAIVKSLTNTLAEVEDDPGSRINIHDVRVEETILIRDLLSNYLKKQQRK